MALLMKNFWKDLDSKMVESIRNTLDRRVQFYEDEIRKLTEQRFMPVWNFCNFFILKESLVFMFEMAHLHEDSLCEYDELELCYLETGKEVQDHMIAMIFDGKISKTGKGKKAARGKIGLIGY